MNKYRNKKVVVCGQVFDSVWESEVFLILKSELKNSEVLSRQVKFVLQEDFVNRSGKMIRPMAWVADFVIYQGKPEDENIKRVIDAKGYKTSVYRLKKKLFEHRYKLAVEEYMKPRKRLRRWRSPV